MLFFWHQTQRYPKYPGSAAMPGEEEGHVSKQGIWVREEQGFPPAQHLQPGETQPKHHPAWKPGGEWDGQRHK